MQINYLSYPITESMPVYGGSGKPELCPLKAIRRGDSCNTWRVGFENHWGTHVDGPNHFFAKGPKVIDYPADFWMFDHPSVLNTGLEPGELLQWETIADRIAADTDLLLLKSGWGQMRGLDVYWNNNPGIHADVGIGLRQMNCAVRAVGIDWISVSSFAAREEGRKAHRTFLDPDDEEEPILLIEDMDLSANLSKLARVWVAPLRVEAIDSTPCTVIGFLDD